MTMLPSYPLRSYAGFGADAAPMKMSAPRFTFTQAQMDCTYAGGKYDPKTGKCDTQDWKYFAKLGGAVVAAYLVYKLATR